MVYQPEAWLTSSMLPCDRSKHWPSKKLYWRETSALHAAIAQHGAASFCGQRYRSVAVWTIQYCMLTGSGHVTFFPCSDDVLSLKQPGHMVASLNLVILHSWMQGYTAVRDVGNMSLSWVFIPSFLSQGLTNDAVSGSRWTQFMGQHSHELPEAGTGLHGVATAQGHWLLLGKVCR